LTDTAWFGVVEVVVKFTAVGPAVFVGAAFHVLVDVYWLV
jgi:hypothetical protein